MAQTCLFAIHFERGSKQSPPRLPKKRPKTITASSSLKNSNATDCVGCATHASPVHALSTAGLQATCCMCKQHVACPAWRNARGHRVTCVCSRTGVQMHVLRCCSPAKSRATALNTCLYTCRVHMLIHMSIHLSTQTSMHMSVHRGAACKYCDTNSVLPPMIVIDSSVLMIVGFEEGRVYSGRPSFPRRLTLWMTSNTTGPGRGPGW